VASEGKKQVVFVGLGNPGIKYERTRHNIGYMIVKSFASKKGWSFKEEEQFNAYVAKGQIGDATVHLLLPTTYMNLSGMAVKAYLDYFKFGIDSLIVISDDVALPFGQMRLRAMGSHGGQNGLRSIEAHLASTHYVRLRMGIGSPQERQELANYVLAPFSSEEVAALAAFIDRGGEVMQNLLGSTLLNAMNATNMKPPVTGEEKKNESKQTKSL
jgi:peptidyl-tRNA hydrolase, PTH1 family